MGRGPRDVTSGAPVFGFVLILGQSFREALIDHFRGLLSAVFPLWGSIVVSMSIARDRALRETSMEREILNIIRHHAVACFAEGALVDKTEEKLVREARGGEVRTLSLRVLKGTFCITGPPPHRLCLSQLTSPAPACAGSDCQKLRSTSPA